MKWILSTQIARFAACVALFFFCFSFSLVSHAAEVIQKKQPPRLYVVVLGVSKFKDSFWPTLKWAEDDAKRFADKIGSGTQFEQMKSVLINENATLNSVRAKLKEISTTAKKDDVVLLYISSHGTLRTNKKDILEPVVVLHDSSHESLIRSVLPHSELKQWVANLKSRRNAIILATCHSGVGKSKYTDEVVAFRKGEKGSALRPFDAVSEGTLILAASARNQTALESDDLKADVYSHYLLEALDVADRNGDGAVSLLEAHDYARVRTYAFTKGRQLPTVEAEMIGDADFPLKGRQKSDGLPILEAYSAKYEGYLVGIEKGENVTLPSALPLKDGSNHVRVYESSESEPREFILKASAGEKISLQQILEPPPFYLGLSGEYLIPMEARFERLTGKKNYIQYKLHAGYLWQNFDLSAHYKVKQSFANQIRPNLKSSLNRNSWGLQTGFQYSLLEKKFRLSLKPALLLNYNQNSLAFRDNNSGDEQISESKSWSYGYQFDCLIGFQTWPYALVLGGGQEFEKNDFAPFGSINMNASRVHLGILWNFGSKAREI